MELDRREFLRAIAAGLALAAGGCGRSRPRIEGELLGPNAAWGHRLRDGAFPAPANMRRTRALVVGGGIAGLSAAWQLQRSGVDDFALLELESDTGGNARCGDNAVTGYPWGAHYLPLPTREAGSLIELLSDLRVITGSDAHGAPVYDERYLLSPPDERLFQLGAWRPGLRPQVSARAENEFARFDALIRELQLARGADGAPAFTTPMQASSRDARYTALDDISMAQWLDQHELRDPALRWFAQYGTRDDFGCTLEHTSAWAGLHYYAGRQVWGDYSDGEVLTWPQGNGWLAARLRERLGARVHCARMAVRIAQDGAGVSVDTWDGAQVERWQAQRLILCVPGYVRERLLPDAPRCARAYNPWLVANLHVRELPRTGGAELAWDNVLYDSPGLGYVVATHQQLRQHTGASVLTYYLPFPDGGADARRLLLETSWEHWRDFILDDLRRAHPDVDEVVTRADIWRWGHGMVAPAPGLLSSAALARVREPQGRVHFAHSDLSGVSLFEEAHWWGVRAANQVLAAL